MAVADTAKLVVDLSLKGNFARQMKANQTALDKFAKGEGRAFRAGQQIGTGIRRGAVIAAGGVALLASQVALGLDSLIELEQQQAQTNAVIKSTGGIAGVTADEVGRLAEKYESLNATVGDEVIREGENLLLTFTNINKKAFEPALATALDMNTALGKGPDGLTGTIKVLGKALNDPTKGLLALNRAGITFTQEQQKRIKGLQKEGDLYGAQAIIIEELDKRFGGSFLAQGGTTAGKVAKFTDAVEDLQRSLATALLPVVGNVADALSDLLQDPEIMRGVENLGRELGKLFSAENVKEGARIVGDVVRSIAAAAPTIGAGLSTAATVIGKVVSAFQKLPPEVQQLAIGAIAVNKLTGGLITNIAGGIFGALKAMTVQAGVVNVTGGIVKGPGAIPGLPAGGGAAAAGAAGIGAGVAVLGGGIVAAISLAATEAANKVFSRGGNQANFKPVNPLDFPGLIHNFQELINIAKNPPPSKQQLAETKRQAERALQGQRQGERGVDLVRQAAIRGAQDTVRETARGAAQTQAVLRSTAAQTQAALRASRPIVNVDVKVSATTVQKTINVTSRTGAAGGSRARGTGAGVTHR